MVQVMIQKSGRRRGEGAACYRRYGMSVVQAMIQDSGRRRGEGAACYRRYGRGVVHVVIQESGRRRGADNRSRIECDNTITADSSNRLVFCNGNTIEADSSSSSLVVLEWLHY